MAQKTRFCSGDKLNNATILMTGHGNMTWRPSGRPRDKLPLMKRIPLVLPEVQVQVDDIRWVA